MQDSYGDGWNGASIDVEVNGVNIANFTITSGSSKFLASIFSRNKFSRLPAKNHVFFTELL